MSSRTSSGLLLPVVIVVGLVVIFGGSKVIDAIEGIFSSNDPVIVGEGDIKVMVVGAFRARHARSTLGWITHEEFAFLGCSGIMSAEEHLGNKHTITWATLQDRECEELDLVFNHCLSSEVLADSLFYKLLLNTCHQRNPDETRV
jgi:hypothetical protein